MIKRPDGMSGMRHIALFCKNLDGCLAFYTKIIGMQIEWQPDADNVYLTSGNDNLALHRASMNFNATGDQYLDHLGFIILSPELVDDWYNYMEQHNVELLTKPKTHRDGARSFYCMDPDGRRVQIIFHLPIS